MRFRIGRLNFEFYITFQKKLPYRQRVKNQERFERLNLMMMRIPYTQNQVARILEVSDSFISQWLAGKRNSQRVEQGFERLYKKHYAGQSEPA